MSREIINIDIRTDAKQSEQEVNKLKKSFGDFNTFTKTSQMNLQQMRRELRELGNVDFGSLSPEQIKKVEQRMGELTDASQKMQKRVNAIATDTFPAMVQGLQMITAGVQIAVGAFSLFGASSEQAEKLQKTMVQLIGVTQALSQLQQAYAAGVIQTIAAKIKSIAVGIKDAVVKTTQTTVTWGLVAAMGAYVAILASAVIGATMIIKKWDELSTWGRILAVVLSGPLAPILLLIKYFDDLVNIGKKVINFLSPFGDVFEIVDKTVESTTKKTNEYIEALKEQQKAQAALIKDMEFEIRMMRARGESIDDIKAKERELLVEQINAAKINAELFKAEIIRKARMGILNNEALNNIKEEIRLIENLRDDLKVFDAEEKTRKTQKSTNKKQEVKEQEEASMSMVDIVKAQIKEEQIIRDQLLLEKKQEYADGIINEEEYQDAINDIKKESLLLESILLEEIEGLEEEHRLKSLEYENLIADEKIQIAKEESEEKKRIKQEELDAKLAAEQRYYEELTEYIKDVQGIISGVVYESIQLIGAGEEGMKDFMKNMSLMIIDLLEKQVLASVASATIQSMSMPDAIATFGAAGLIRAAILTALIKGAFAGVKGLISRPPKMEKGGMLSGNRHSRGGILVEGEDNEAMINRNSMMNPISASLASIANEMGGGVPLVDKKTSIIDYNLLASMINDKKVYVVETDITDTQKRVDVIENLTRFG